METETRNEIESYDSYLIELTEIYKRICNLYDLKDKFINDFYEKYSYEDSLFLDYLLTQKIENILK